MRRLKWILPFLCIAFAAFVAGVTTYVTPGTKTPQNRFYDPHSGVTAVDLAITSANQTVSLDSTMAGYLTRIVYWADGTDSAYTITVTDTSSCTLFTKADCTAVGDPYTYVTTILDTSGNSYGGIPFIGGLSVTLADANDGDTTAVNIRLYVSEQWRR